MRCGGLPDATCKIFVSLSRRVEMQIPFPVGFIHRRAVPLHPLSIPTYNLFIRIEIVQWFLCRRRCRCHSKRRRVGRRLGIKGVRERGREKAVRQRGRRLRRRHLLRVVTGNEGDFVILDDRQCHVCTIFMSYGIGRRVIASVLAL